ncbi:protein mono-ADP-ribosyltransferase PARP4-like [Haliotis asinina]|uniref:protein mono-ADP-ribosyltransferase PARP4-like n=1 Tax=Haliotis asinina TaxID=109174 RepID=UPI003531BDBB
MFPMKEKEDSKSREFRFKIAQSEEETECLALLGEKKCKKKQCKKKAALGELSETRPKDSSDEPLSGIVQDKNAVHTVVLPVMELGVGLPCIREYRVELNAARISTLLTLQQKDGFWEFCSDLDQSLGINSDACKTMLFKAGLKSLGISVADEMLHLLATLLVIFSILEVLCPELFPLSFNSHLEYSSQKHQIQQSQKGIQDELLTPVLQKSLSQGLDFCLDSDRKHPLICRSLELGPDWVSVTALLLGLKKEQGTMAISGLKTLRILLDDLGILQPKVIML